MDVRLERSYLTKNGIDMCDRCSFEIIAQDTILHSNIAFYFEQKLKYVFSHREIKWL